MRRINRKSTPKVVGGQVLRKNNHKETPNYWNSYQEDVIIDVDKPGKGYKHFLKKRDIIQFIDIIPNWDKLSYKLDAIVLTKGGLGYDGIYDNNGVICLSAWEEEQDVLMNKHYFSDHKDLFERLGVKSEERNDDVFCEFTPDQIKAYQLLHILLHELGHHYDRILTKSKKRSARGEQFAEDFAFTKEEQIWYDYQAKFNVVF